MNHHALGWILITTGFLGGLALGTGFLRDEFLGGYDAPERRLLRLGHIALIALGVLNILFAYALEEIDLGTPWTGVASTCIAVGGIGMPTACGLVAWRRILYPLFAVPALCLVTAAALVAWGYLS
ncbi:MAG: hypothetical protein ACYTGC_09585 [Planctomycetota bacterium]